MNKSKVVSGFIWKFAEQFSTQIVSFIVSIILARLLMPEDYSVVTIISILSSFCAVFIDGGLGNSLIQKKDTDEIDYSTVLIVSLLLSLLIYFILFFLAPFIAKVYNKTILINVIRVYSLSLFIGAFNNVQGAYISKKLMFKSYFLASFFGTVISAFVGIYMAYKNYGAWALVMQQLVNITLDAFILHITSDFRPTFMFSYKRLITLWEYGKNVLGTSVLDMVYDNIRPLVVGIKFNTVDLAFYQKGKSYPGLLNSTLITSLSSVLFPVIANSQDDMNEVKRITQQYIKVASFIIIPSLFGLAAISENLVIWMITEKWIPIVPYMQIFCINFLFLFLQKGNLQALYAVGKSDIVLKLSIIKKFINFILLFLVIVFSSNPLVLAGLGIITSFIAYILNAFTNKTIMNYGLKDQFYDYLPNLINGIIMYLVVGSIGKMLNGSVGFVLVIQVLIGIAVYTSLSYISRNESLMYCLHIINIHRA